jgi:hypothetical protein
LSTLSFSPFHHFFLSLSLSFLKYIMALCSCIIISIYTSVFAIIYELILTITIAP